MALVTRTYVVQTTVYGTHAYHVKCECGYQSKRYAREVTAAKHARLHGATHQPKGGM